MSLPTYDLGDLSPHEVRHTLDDDWSTLSLGNRKISVRRDDLDRVRDARELARVIAAQAAFWERDLAALEEKLTAPDEPYGGDDPALDAAVARVAELADAQRTDAERAFEQPTDTPDSEDEK